MNARGQNELTATDAAVRHEAEVTQSENYSDASAQCPGYSYKREDTTIQKRRLS